MPIRSALYWLCGALAGFLLMGALEADFRAGARGFAAGLLFVALWAMIHRREVVIGLMSGEALRLHGMNYGLIQKPRESPRAFRKRILERIRELPGSVRR